MSTVFLKILNMSIAASWLIAVVLLVRFLLKKAPKWISCVLWALVALRLVIPFSFQSSLSLLPSRETITYKNVTNEDEIADPAKPAENASSPSGNSGARSSEVWIPVIDSGVKVIDNALNPVIERAYKSEDREPVPATPSTPSGELVPADASTSDIAPAPAATKADLLKTWTLIAAIVWIAGTAGLLIYALVSYLRLRKKVSASIPLWGNVQAADGIRTPFILGIFKPVIYVPSSLRGEELDYVLAHEEAHLARRDHLWKPLGYLLLAIYWFNPLCWVAYILLCRDIESACDEKAVKFMDHEEMAEYSQTLLNLSVQRHQIAACPVAFGEVNVKQRIKSVLNYKKPAFWVVIVALIACLVVAGCFLTDPKKETDPGSSEAETTEAVKDPTEAPTQEPTEKPTEEATLPGPSRTEISEEAFYAGLSLHTLDADMFSWYFENEYNGEKLQILPNRSNASGEGYGNNPVTFAGAVYYRKELTDLTFSDVIDKMQEAICGIYTQEENRARNGYVMTDYHIYPIQSADLDASPNWREAGEDVWVINGLNITYKYDGKDFGLTFDEMKEDSQVDEYGLIPCFGDGSEDVNQKVIVRRGDVYLLAEPTYFTRHQNCKPYEPKDAEALVLQEGDVTMTSPSGLNIVSRTVDAASWNALKDHSELCDAISAYFKGSVTGTLTESQAANDVIEKSSILYNRTIYEKAGWWDQRKPWYDPASGQYWFICEYCPEGILYLGDDYSLVRMYACGYRHILELKKQGGSWIVADDVIMDDFKGISEFLSADKLRRWELIIWSTEHFSGQKAVDSAKIALDFGTVAAKGETLDEGTMKKIEEFFRKDSSMYPWYFIRQSFNDPSEIDIYLLFDSGIENELSSQEQAAAWGASGATGFGAHKIMVQSAKDLFTKYTGQDLTEDQMKAFSKWLYIPEFDAYYSFRTDAPDDLRTNALGRGVRLSAAKAAELGLPVATDGMIAVEWTGSTGAGPKGPQRYGMVLLIPDGDSYRIVANLVFEK